jgi:hypothetical protein
MDVSSKREAPAHDHGDSLVSHVLHAKQDAPETDLTVTWVELDPNSAQSAHSHDSERVYVLVEGTGVSYQRLKPVGFRAGTAVSALTLTVSSFIVIIASRYRRVSNELECWLVRLGRALQDIEYLFRTVFLVALFARDFR